MRRLTKLRFTLALLIASFSAYAFAVAALGAGAFGMSDGGGF